MRKRRETRGKESKTREEHGFIDQMIQSEGWVGLLASSGRGFHPPSPSILCFSSPLVLPALLEVSETDVSGSHV